MLGAIAGDVIGSLHEFAGTKTREFELFEPGCSFTDDSVLTVAVAEWLLDGGDLAGLFHRYARSFPRAGYGGMFHAWVMKGSREPYGSYGNGAAMRVSPVGFAFSTLEETLAYAERSSAVTHDHPEGIRGARATAAAVFLARHVRDREEIRSRLEALSGYDLRFRLDDIRPAYEFDETCAGTVPEAIVAFLESADFEDAIRNAISLGGDADTLACITGGIAEAYYGGVPPLLASETLARLDPGLRSVVERFRDRFVPARPS